MVRPPPSLATACLSSAANTYGCSGDELYRDGGEGTRDPAGTVAVLSETKTGNGQVREASNNEPWGASSTLMQEIANGTFN